MGEWQVQGQGQVQVQVQVQVLMSRCWGTRAEGHGDTAAREGASTDGWAGGRWRAVEQQQQQQQKQQQEVDLRSGSGSVTVPHPGIERKG